MVRASSSEITPEGVYLSRRKFLIGAGTVLAGSVLLSACERGGVNPPPAEDFCTDARAQATADELSAPLTTCEDITTYNNFYEFSLNKRAVAEAARGFRTSPWELKVGGLVEKPRTYTMEEILRLFPQEERVYRMRCVEAWSVVAPWVGFPLAALLREAAPTPGARFVRFESLYDPKQMPGQKETVLPWPYVEGLRLDEAMHDLTIMATGLYGKSLPPQEGAPIRLVVPWKYGFKSIKSVVKIDMVSEMPVSAWMATRPDEYGFYANVNPDVPHPRWSQAAERRIGGADRMLTLPFNGYADEVARLYAGMDLRREF